MDTATVIQAPVAGVAAHGRAADARLWRFLALALVALLPFLGLNAMPGDARAEGGDVNATLSIGKDNGGVGAVANAINKGTEYDILSYDSAEGIVTFDNHEYAQLDTGERRDYMKTALSAVRTSELSTMAKNRLYNFIADQDKTTSAALRNLQTDSQADVATATAWLRPFSGIVSTILGVIALTVFLFLAISAVFDTAYITIPMVRVFTSKEGTRPFFITHEAYSAVQEAEGAGEGKYRSPLGLYFKRRAVVMFWIGLCLLYLISGQIYDLVAFIIDAFSPLTEQLTP